MNRDSVQDAREGHEVLARIVHLTLVVATRIPELLREAVKLGREHSESTAIALHEPR